jgi:hypothetical protein
LDGYAIVLNSANQANGNASSGNDQVPRTITCRFEQLGLRTDIDSRHRKTMSPMEICSAVNEQFNSTAPAMRSVSEAENERTALHGQERDDRFGDDDVDESLENYSMACRGVTTRDLPVGFTSGGHKNDSVEGCETESHNGSESTPNEATATLGLPIVDDYSFGNNDVSDDSSSESPSTADDEASEISDASSSAVSQQNVSKRRYPKCNRSRASERSAPLKHRRLDVGGGHGGNVEFFGGSGGTDIEESLGSESNKKETSKPQVQQQDALHDADTAEWVKPQATKNEKVAENPIDLCSDDESIDTGGNEAGSENQTNAIQMEEDTSLNSSLGATNIVSKKTWEECYQHLLDYK